MKSQPKPKKRCRRSIEEEIADTEARAPHESVVISTSIPRALYLHALRCVLNGDYASVSAYISNLVRRDKHNNRPV